MGGTQLFRRPVLRQRAIGVRIATTAGALVAGGLIVVAPAQLASAEPDPGAECQGKPVTIAATADGQTLEGTAQADVIDTAGFASVTVHGNDGDDLICVRNAAGARAEGGAGNDTIVDEYANPADDAAAVGDRFRPEDHDGSVLVGGPGNDTLTGTADTLVTYADDPGPVRVDVVAGTVTQGTQGTEQASTDTVSGISRFVGTSYADTFVGGPQTDYFVGGPAVSPEGKIGHDTINSGGGADNVTAQLASVDLGEGDDVAWVYGGRTQGAAGNDDITIISRGTVLGGPGDDRITGVSDAADTTISSGKFWLRGNSGNDRITPAVARDAAGRATCAKGCTTSSVRGGSGADWIIFADAPAMRVNLRAGVFRSTNPRGQVAGVDNIWGSAFDDRLFGDDLPNRIRGGAGHDELRGRAGADLLRGGPGRDVAYGGTGKDRCLGSAETHSC